MSEKESVRIAEIEAKLDQLIAYIYNDARTGRKGLVQEVDDLKTSFSKFLEQYKLKEAVKKAKMGVWGMVGGALLLGLKWLIEKIVAHL